jgi:hypothetical protein
MRPMRSFGGGGGFGFSGVESMAARLAIGLVAGSVLALVVRPLGALLVLTPRAVFPGLMLWQPFTYAFVELSPLGIIFGAFLLYSIGGSLEMSWGWWGAAPSSPASSPPCSGSSFRSPAPTPAAG